MTLDSCVAFTVARLKDVYSPGESRWMVREIFKRLKGWSQVDMVIRGNEDISPYIEHKVADVTERLLRHEPIQYIFGMADFYGLELKVTPDVLIPRPETAELVDMMVRDADGRSDLHVLDICTGSGCIAVALARNLKFAHVEAWDLSDKALIVAKNNAEMLNVKVDLRHVDALHAEWTGGEKYDMIVSNPPYIAESERSSMEANVLEHEPAMALFVPDDNPLVFYTSISVFAMDALVEGGRVYFEINPHYASELKDYMLSQGWDNVDVMADMQRLNRFLVAQKPGR